MTSSASRDGFDPKVGVEERELASEAVDVASPPAESTEPSVEEEASALEAKKSKPLQAIIELLHDLAIAVVVCVLLITYVVQAFKVQGTSMSPELGDGQRILVNKFLYYVADIDRGDVVVFWYPEDPTLSFIKRVIGLPGETVEVREGVVYVDDHPIDEPYVSEANADNRSYRPVRIRPGHYFVLGDNRSGSNDSRSWGLVPERYIYGKAFLRIWPLPNFGTID
ncbi:MAG TPA: signal peptidase I [Vicinamibacteria bacterium]|nr:signal peptidase I [Vicinamibacteria bacterium]